MSPMSSWPATRRSPIPLSSARPTVTSCRTRRTPSLWQAKPTLPFTRLVSTRLNVNKVVRKKLGTRKASFADAATTEQLTGMTIGGVTPFGLPADLPLWVDAQVLTRTSIVLGGGSRDRKLIAPPEILLALGADVVDDLALEPAP